MRPEAPVHRSSHDPNVRRYVGLGLPLAIVLVVGTAQHLLPHAARGAGALPAVALLLLGAGTGTALVVARARLTARDRVVLLAGQAGAVALGVLGVLAWGPALPPRADDHAPLGVAPLLALVATLGPPACALGTLAPVGVRLVAKGRPRLLRVTRFVCIALAVGGAALAVAAAAIRLPGWLGVVLHVLGASGLVALAAGRRARPGFGGSADDAPLWRPPGHFYSPLPDLAQVRADAARLFVPGLHPMPGLDLRLDAQRALLRELARRYGEEDFAERPGPAARYCLANDYFCYGDAFAWHALLRHLRPRRVVEIGSGWSSAVLLDTDERHLGNSIDCTFVEPFPDRLLALMRPADRARVRLLPQRVQDVPLDLFTALGANDVLFVDSSHVCKTGSDVHHVLFEILPRLAPGVWVHVHDVLANFEYPADWVLEGRAWNEAYVLRAFLAYNREFTIELHAASLAAAGVPELTELAPKWAASPGGSLWLRRRSP